MSHIVIHEDSAGSTQYRQFDDLGSAVQFIEEQRNDGVDSARLFELNEIHLAVKSYFKVEVAESAAAAPAAPVVETPSPAVEAPVADTPVAPVETETVEAVPAAVADVVAEPIDDVSYVEAAMASPIDAFATEAPPLSDFPADPVESGPSTEVRRGLFGR